MKNIISILGRYKTGQEPSPLIRTKTCRMAENNRMFPTIKLNTKSSPYRKSCLLKLLFDLNEKNLFKRKLSQKITLYTMTLTSISLIVNLLRRNINNEYSTEKHTIPVIIYRINWPKVSGVKNLFSTGILFR